MLELQPQRPKLECDFESEIKRAQCLLNDGSCEEGYEMLKGLAEKGCGEAMLMMRKCCLKGLGIDRNLKLVNYWTLEAWKAKYSVPGRLIEAAIYESPELNEKMKGFVETELQGRADSGDVVAQRMVGDSFSYGIGRDSDAESAAMWYKRAYEGGDLDAQFLYGKCTEFGKGLKANFDDAMRLYFKAAERGNADAQNRVGEFFEKADDLDMHMYKAITWYEKASERGNPLALYHLGMCYLEGKYYKVDMGKCFQLLKQSAEEGDCPEAQYELGILNAEGKIDGANLFEAIKWTTLAAEQEYGPAQCLLGQLFMYGQGSCRSTEEAIFWLVKASCKGVVEANSLLVSCLEKAVKEGMPTGNAFQILSFTASSESLERVFKNFDSHSLNSVGRSLLCLGDVDAAFLAFSEAGRREDDMSSLINLGLCYAFGISTAKKPFEAIKCWNKAMNAGRNQSVTVIGWESQEDETMLIPSTCLELSSLFHFPHIINTFSFHIIIQCWNFHMSLFVPFVRFFLIILRYPHLF